MQQFGCLQIRKSYDLAYMYHMIVSESAVLINYDCTCKLSAPLLQNTGFVLHGVLDFLLLFLDIFIRRSISIGASEDTSAETFAVDSGTSVAAFSTSEFKEGHLVVST
jgi:hypothetical protein